MYYSLAEGTCLYGLETPTIYMHELGGKHLVWVARQTRQYAQHAVL